MSRTVRQFMGLVGEMRFERQLTRELRQASPRLRDEYFAALRDRES